MDNSSLLFTSDANIFYKQNLTLSYTHPQIFLQLLCLNSKRVFRFPVQKIQNGGVTFKVPDFK